MKIPNISSEATVTKFCVEPSEAEGTNICPNGPGHIKFTNMAALPVDSKSLSKFSSLA